MAPRLGERCENCFKHLRLGHLEGASCEMCLPSDGTLRRCNSCQIVRYCVRFLTLFELARIRIDETGPGVSEGALEGP